MNINAVNAVKTGLSDGHVHMNFDIILESLRKFNKGIKSYGAKLPFFGTWRYFKPILHHGAPNQNYTGAKGTKYS